MSTRKRETLFNAADFEIQTPNVDSVENVVKEETTQDVVITNKSENYPKQETQKGKRKPGRPKQKVEETKIINVAVPESVITKLEIAKVCYKDNITMYINTLIEKDLAENYEKYENMYKQLNEFKL